MDTRLLVAALTLLLANPTLQADAPPAPPAGAIQVHRDRLPWKPAPPSLPAGAEAALLEGDPRDAGLFTMRIRVPAGTRLMPHTHPGAERITVLSGALGLGFGTVYDQTRMRVFGPGDYYMTPAGLPHFLGFAEDTEVQITTEGPWGLDYLKP